MREWTFQGMVQIAQRPACIVMWYSAPVAEELCEGYKGVQHARDSTAATGIRWDSPTLKIRHGKKLVRLFHKLCVYHCLEHVSAACKSAENLCPSSHVHFMPCAGTWSSARMSSCLQHSKQLLSRTWGKRGERIGEAKQPGPATEAVVTRKEEGQQPQKIIASFCKSSSTWKWSTNVAPRSFGANRPTPGKRCRHGVTLTEGNSLMKA